jgi:CRISPR/Cas system-associated exonuclease Cas4 (RecB family)
MNDEQQLSLLPDEEKPVTVLGPPIGYVDMLDEATAKKIAEDAKRPRNKNPLRPSSAGKCAREKAYEFAEYRGIATYEKPAMNPDTYRLLNLGHSVEWNILRQFDDLVEGFETRYKQQTLSFYKISESEWVEGSTDVVFWSPTYKCAVDIKSKKDKFSSYFSNKWDEDSAKLENMDSVTQISERSFWVEDLEAFLVELNDPFFRSNFVQLNSYAVNPFLKERGIDHAAIIQYNKNDSRLREVRFKPSQALFDKLMETDQMIARVVDSTRDPENVPRDYVLGSMKCGFCDFKAQCWPESQDAQKAYFNTFPKKLWPKDTNRMGPLGTKLEMLYESFKRTVEQTDIQKQIEAEILATLEKAGAPNKIRFPDGAVYEVKFLKSPRPHYELRRTKA